MSMTLAQFAQPFSFDYLQQIVVVNGAISRLLMACLLGLLKPEDWQAQWIGLDASPPTDGSTIDNGTRERLAKQPWTIRQYMGIRLRTTW